MGNDKISARPDKATNLFQILILTRFVSKRAIYTLQFLKDNFACPKRRFSGNCPSKRQAERVVNKSLQTFIDVFVIVISSEVYR